MGISKKLFPTFFPHTDCKLCTSSSLLWLCKYCWSMGSDMGALPSSISFHVAVIFFPPSAHNCNQSFTHLVFPLQPPWLLLRMSRPLLYGNNHEMIVCLYQTQRLKENADYSILSLGAKSKIGMKTFHQKSPSTDR